MGVSLMRPMYCMFASVLACEAVISGTPTGSGMQVQPPGRKLGIPWINDTMGPELLFSHFPCLSMDLSHIRLNERNRCAVLGDTAVDGVVTQQPHVVLCLCVHVPPC